MTLLLIVGGCTITLGSAALLHALAPRHDPLHYLRPVFGTLALIGFAAFYIALIWTRP